jgi:Predicted membrane protein (DUF2306)
LGPYKNIISIVALVILAFFSFLMIRIMFIYIPIKNDVGFLQLKQSYLHITEWRLAFFIHVFSSILVLLAGFTQFSSTILKRYKKWHRALGYTYVSNILLITGPAGLLMSFYANGGIGSRIGFIMLSVLWFFFTAMALYKAVKKQFIAHRIFMIRSFALTLSAITLRCWKVLLANFTDIAPMDRYRLIAWLGWTLNLLIAEWYIYKFIKQGNKNII